MKKLIFVVDDDDAVRSALKFELELAGLRVETCASGAELLAHPKWCDAACLVIDRKMPDMDGFAVAEELRARKSPVPIIFIVSDLNAEVRRRAVQAGGRCVLEKPLLGNILADSVWSAVGGAPA